MVSVHDGFEPNWLQAPPQLSNTLLGVATAVSVTTVPLV